MCSFILLSVDSLVYFLASRTSSGASRREGGVVMSGAWLMDKLLYVARADFSIKLPYHIHGR